MTRPPKSASGTDDAGRFDVAIVGGGLVGMATAMALVADADRAVVVLEAEDGLARHQSGHNSGVIHSGLYYRPGSQKAVLCTAGRDALYTFAAEHGIPHERCGKLVVATSADELARLDELERRGRANGLAALRRLGADEIRSHEPHAQGLAALLVGDTGIIDYARVLDAYADVVRSRGGVVRTGARVRGLRQDGDRIVVETGTGIVRVQHLVNCAGLHSDRIARLAGVDPGVDIVPFRGEYWVLADARRGLVRNLVYPVPDPAFPFLGVHFTRRIDGRVEAGPNAILAFAREGYRRSTVSARDLLAMVASRGFWRMVRRHWRAGVGEIHRAVSTAASVDALRRLVPDVRAADLVRAGAGVRAQAVDRSGVLVDDFRIVEAARMTHVVNAPSPAATASIAIGRTIARRVVGRLDGG